MTGTVHTIAAGLGSSDIVTLEQTGANLQHAAASGRQWSGQIYVATPQLLRAFGIKASDINPAADILSMRPGLSGISHMELLYGNGKGGGSARRTGPAGTGDELVPVPEEQLPR